MIYLDHNATAPLLPAARAAMLDALDRCWANPDSPHAAGRAAAMAVDRARSAVAALVGRDPRELIFTSGATEANALALSGLCSDERPEVWVSAVEHPSALAWGTRRMPVDGRGVIELAALEAALGKGADRVAVLSVMAANHETGVLQPVAEVAELARRAGVPFHCDATQIPGRVTFTFDADLITISAHKFGGPKGVGALLSRARLRPLLRGGSQERGRRAGTPNVPGIVGMGAAAAEIAGTTQDPGARDRLEAACRALGGLILGEGAPRLPNTLAVLFPVPGDLVVSALDLEGIAVSAGATCASGSSAPSPVLAAMGVHGTPVRFSLGPDSRSPVGCVEAALPALARVMARMEVLCASS